MTEPWYVSFVQINGKIFNLTWDVLSRLKKYININFFWDTKFGLQYNYKLVVLADKSIQSAVKTIGQQQMSAIAFVKKVQRSLDMNKNRKTMHDMMYSV